MAHILYCHDTEYFAVTKAEIYRNLGHEVTACETARDSLNAIARIGKTIDVAVIHKDMGKSSDEEIRVDEIVQALRNSEPLIRALIISGKFPFGLDHVLTQTVVAFSLL